MSRRPWTVNAGGIVVTMRLTPNGGRDAIELIETLSDGRSLVKARVTAAATDGEANAALVRLLARELQIPPRQVQISAGHTSRNKRVTIEGDGKALAAALQRLTQSE
jgi:uncharacterized protein